MPGEPRLGRRAGGLVVRHAGIVLADRRPRPPWYAPKSLLVESDIPVEGGSIDVTVARTAPGSLRLRDAPARPARARPRPADDRRVRRPVHGRSGSRPRRPPRARPADPRSPTSSIGSTRPTSTGSSPRAVVADVALQLQANWMADYRNSSGIVVDDGPYGPTVDDRGLQPRSIRGSSARSSARPARAASGSPSSAASTDATSGTAERVTARPHELTCLCPRRARSA